MLYWYLNVGHILLIFSLGNSIVALNAFIFEFHVLRSKSVLRILYTLQLQTLMSFDEVFSLNVPD